MNKLVPPAVAPVPTRGIAEDEESTTAAATLITQLRTERFNEDTEATLASHPIVKAAEAGELTMAQRRAFAGEQFRIQRSDARSFARLAGREDGLVSWIMSMTTLPNRNRVGTDSEGDLFSTLLEGELSAAHHLKAYAKGVGMTMADLEAYETSALCQGYPSYLSNMALADDRVAAAAAAAVNFPTWGRMCGRLLAALSDTSLGYGYTGADDPGLAFLAIFATPIPDLDTKAARTMAATIRDRGAVPYADIARQVRVLQQYEILFWDGIFATRDT